MSAASIPKILLGLGATCLLVAAVVFLVVAWSDLAMGTRTAILLTLTAGAAVTTGWMARRALPAGAESFGVLFPLPHLDVFGADNAGWLGDLSTEGFTVLLGSVLLVAGLGTAYAAARAAVPALVVRSWSESPGPRWWRPVATPWPTSARWCWWSPWSAPARWPSRPDPAPDGRHLVRRCRHRRLVARPAHRRHDPDRVHPHAGRGLGRPRRLAAAGGSRAGRRTGRDARLPLDLRLLGSAIGATIAAYVAVAPAIDEPETTLALVGLAVVAVGCAVALLARGAWRWVCVVPTGLAALLLVVLAAMRGATALSTLLGQGLWELGSTSGCRSSSTSAVRAVLLPACVLGASLTVLVFCGSPTRFRCVPGSTWPAR